MKSLMSSSFRLSFIIFFLLTISCKKDSSSGDQNEMVYAVNFKFSGFTNNISRLKATTINQSKLAAVGSNSQNYSEGYLYYWSFNNDNLVPDIKFNNQLNPNISYLNGDLPSSFVNSTYVYESFVGGRALTFAGAKEILIKMPIKDVIEVNGLGFDVGSPGTGPKDFELYYSLDKGISYDTLAFNNQFGNTNTANQKHTYSYDLSDKDIRSDEIWFKLSPKAGERGTSGLFNENTGALRMDNLYLTGIAPTTQENNAVDNIHYFLFNKNIPSIVITGVKDINGSSSFAVSIPVGTYSICFISNTSNAELIFPENPTLASFYTSNLFSNSNADIFGYIGELVVDKEQTNQIELERLFSQVKIEFTDTYGLDRITKIVIDQQHDPFFFAPFNASLTNPILDQSTVERIDDFSSNKQIVFNQFLGRLATSAPISYIINVYGNEGVIRTFNLSSSLKNNMQVVFRGNILNEIEHNNNFVILKNEVWDGELITNF